MGCGYARTAESVLQVTGGAWWPADRVEVERNREMIRSALGEADYAIAQKKGAALTLEQVLAFASGIMNHLRVSVATYNKVLFPHPEHGVAMLALERKATVLKDGSVNVRAQPFGGGVKILNTKSLKEVIGEIQFDSDHSQQEQDFRILIHAVSVVCSQAVLSKAS